MESGSFSRLFLLIGVLLILMVVVGPRVRRLPLTTTMLYFGLGWFFGMLGWITLDPIRHSALLEGLSEIAVIVSLFGAGLKLRLPLSSRLWRLPSALAFFAMIVTVGMIAALGVFWLGMPLGAAIVLGAVLAPTDPVLASDVQVGDAQDTDRVRFTLTGEAGMNDGSAFPLVMLGLGLLGRHELGAGYWRWWVADVAWASVGGLACGAVLGLAVGRLVIFLRRSRHEAVGLDDFLALGLIAASYGLALLLHAYGFLAVFAAGLALRQVERELSPNDAPVDVKAAAGTPEELASHPEHAPAYMAEAVLHFNEQLERVAELALVLLLGSLMVRVTISFQAAAFAAVLLAVIRPLAAAPFALAFGMDRIQTALVSWFGIRGIGSVYYLFYVVNHGIPANLAELLIEIALCSIALSIAVHGLTVTPFMERYQQQRDHVP